MSNKEKSDIDANDMVRNCLSREAVHAEWDKQYLSSENMRFFDLAFDYIAQTLSAPKDSVILDAGCGNGGHSIRLAQRGFIVYAIDFSEVVREKAKANIKANKLEDRIGVEKGDILNLPLGDNSFSYILCWGVLMHIPDIERAVSELVRVLRPGGMLVIGEDNMYSLESIFSLIIKKFINRRKKVLIKSTPAGLEYWRDTDTGSFMTRETNMRWLIKKLKDKNFIPKKQVARQFTEIYTEIF